MRLTLLLAVLIFLSGNDSSPYTPTKEHFEDPRDGNVYAYTSLHGLNWFTENLRYKMDQSICLSTPDSLCEDCGEFYLMEQAFLACPAGWRLPTVKEIKQLIKLEKRKKVEIRTALMVILCGRIDNRTHTRLGEQNTYWLDAPVAAGMVEHWHVFKEKQEIHAHNVVYAQRQFPVRCVCESSSP